MKRKYVVIANAHSGTAADPQSLTILFKREGIDIVIREPQLGVDKLVAVVQRIKPDAIVACGGDGTVNTAANVAVQTDRILAVLPAGTFNHFAKDIGLPQTLPEAVKVAAHGAVRAIDYATVNGYVFVNSSSLGAYTRAVLRRENLRPALHKQLAMVLGLLTVAKENRSMRLTFELDKGRAAVRTPSVFIGNNKYAIEGMGAATRTRFTDGVLSVFVVKAGPLVSSLKVGLWLLAGKKAGNLAQFDTAKMLRITSDAEQVAVSLDGEVAHMTFPLQYQIHPRDLRVLVPNKKQ